MVACAHLVTRLARYIRNYSIGTHRASGMYPAADISHNNNTIYGIDWI